MKDWLEERKKICYSYEDAIDCLIYRIRNELLKMYPGSEDNADALLSKFRKNLLKNKDNKEFSRFFNHISRCTGVDPKIDMGADIDIELTEAYRTLDPMDVTNELRIRIIFIDGGGGEIKQGYEFRLNMLREDSIYDTVKEYMYSDKKEIDEYFWCYLMIDYGASLYNALGDKSSEDEINEMRYAINNCQFKSLDDYLAARGLKTKDNLY